MARTPGDAGSPTPTRGPVHADVKLAVRKGPDWGLYRQAVAVDSPSGQRPDQRLRHVLPG